ncbi:MAG: hypothetical protein IPL56_03615 [Saprospiraceae bacterium]|nr:hypothetical protein [Saprospiraceae bacterium]
MNVIDFVNIKDTIRFNAIANLPVKINRNFNPGNNMSILGFRAQTCLAQIVRVLFFSAIAAAICFHDSGSRDSMHTRTNCLGRYRGVLRCL